MSPHAEREPASTPTPVLSTRRAPSDEEHATEELRVWTGRIRPHLEQAASSIVSAGRLLLDAKAELPHGQFGPLLLELGLSRQMANRFMRVANNSVIANRPPVGGLPASVSVLDVLARMDDEDLEHAIETGIVTSSTTRTQAEALVAGRSQVEKPDAPDAMETLIRESQLRTAKTIFEAYLDHGPDALSIAVGAIAAEMAGAQDEDKVGFDIVADGVLGLVHCLIAGMEPDPARPWNDQEGLRLETAR